MFSKYADKISMEGSCWMWTGAYTKREKGYGRLRPSPNKPAVCAHRFFYEHYVGEIPSGMFVLHTCDNSMCVNPEHLFLGTQKDNMADMWAKGRQNTSREPLGPKSISEADVAAIFVDARTQSEIAADYSISQALVSNIKRRKLHQKITEGLGIPGVSPRRKHGKLSESDVLAIRADNRMNIEIAEEYGISNQQVSNIKLGRCWASLGEHNG